MKNLTKQILHKQFPKKQTLTTIALVLILTIPTFMMSMPATNAHTPAWNVKTFTYLTVAPNPIGVNQPAIVYMWLDKAPPTASGGYGDKWKGFTLSITKPDGSIENKGPFTSDPVGFKWLMYTPTAVGTYKFKFKFPGQTLAGENLDPFNPSGSEFIGDYFEASESAEVVLTVQQNAIGSYPSTPLPTDYWNRPINPTNHDWWSFSGNWLATPDNHLAAYTNGPETAHILWRKPVTFGGLVGGPFGDTSYHDGDAYEGKWFPPVIIEGVLYYNKFPSQFFGALPGFYAVDLRTGEEIYYNNDTRITLGQIYRYDSPNQHGAFAYLWSVIGGGFGGPPGATWKCYDAFTGDWWYTITGGPAAPFSFTSTPTMTYGIDGSILIPVLDTVKHRLALWNSSAIPDLLAGATGSNAWQWRPYKKTVDGAKGYSWNVSIPADITGAINYIFAGDRIIGSSNLGLGGAGFTYVETTNYTMWALSLKPGQEGQLLWKKTYTLPPGIPNGVTMMAGPASIADKVFTVRSSQTMQWFGFSLDDGQLLWGPTEPQAAWDMLIGTQGYIAYGKFFSGGYGGFVYCYDVKTGELQWTYQLKDPYNLEAKWGGNYNVANMLFADKKLYVFSGEHSPDDPKEQGALVRCVDVETGTELWTFPFYDPSWATNPAIADGLLVHFNAYDNRIYAFGKGPTVTTVAVQNDVVAETNSVLIKGSVTDQSQGAKDTPAIADESMSAWMEYLYLQKPIPGNATGVPVKLTAMGSDGNVIDIGTVTSDMTGSFKKLWTPPAKGEYTITATFIGSKSYWASYGTTAIGVTPAAPSPSLTATPTVTPTIAPTATPAPTASPSIAPTPPGTGLGTEVYIAIAAVIIIIAVAAVAVILRRRK